MYNLKRLIKDNFDDKNLSDLNLRSFGEDFLIRLSNNNLNGDYTQLILSTTAAYQGFFGALSNVLVKEAISQGLTQDMNLKKTAAIGGVSLLQNLIKFKFNNQPLVYQQFFPYDMTEYHQADLDELTPIFDRFITAANTHLLVSNPAEVAGIIALINAFKDARMAQKNVFSMTDTLRTGKHETRKILTLQLTADFLILATGHLENPDRFDDFYDERYLPIFYGDDEEDETTQVEAVRVASITSEVAGASSAEIPPPAETDLPDAAATTQLGISSLDASGDDVKLVIVFVHAIGDSIEGRPTTTLFAGQTLAKRTLESMGWNKDNFPKAVIINQGTQTGHYRIDIYFF